MQHARTDVTNVYKQHPAPQSYSVTTNTNTDMNTDAKRDEGTRAQAYCTCRDALSLTADTDSLEPWKSEHTRTEDEDKDRDGMDELIMRNYSYAMMTFGGVLPPAPITPIPPIAPQHSGLYQAGRVFLEPYTLSCILPSYRSASNGSVDTSSKLSPPFFSTRTSCLPLHSYMGIKSSS